jgi:hypothetical protein
MNTPNKVPTEPDEVNQLVKAYIEYLSNNPYGAVAAEINGALCTVVAAVESEEMNQVQPMFIIPSPELILNIVDVDDKQPIFGISRENLN